MAEFLIKAIDATHPDPDTDEQGCYKKGDIVVVMPDGHEWGGKEGPPTFVIVKVPGVTVEQVEDRRDDWRRELGYEIVATDAAVDGVRVRIWTETPGAANEYGITREQVENWLTKWGASVVSTTTNEVRFDITVQDAYKSEGFWGQDPTTLGITIAEQSYDQGTGVHVATVDVSASSVTVQNAQAQIQEANATITDVTGDVITAEFTRTDVRQHFVDALKDAMRKTVRRRRWRVSDADVDTALGMGGVIEVTPAQLASRILDKAS